MTEMTDVRDIFDSFDSLPATTEALHRPVGTWDAVSIHIE